MEKFSKFITEAKDEPYKLIMFANTEENIRDIGKHERPDYAVMNNAAKAVGIDIFHIEFTGSYISEKNNKMYLNSLDFDQKGKVVLPAEDEEAVYQKPIEINPKNTLLFPRGLGTAGFTNSRYWTDMISLLEDRGFKTIPSIKTWSMCNSKYYCNELFRLHGLKTPKTVGISYSDDTSRALKELDRKFPIILKASSGSQTGVGVVISESERSLHATVQMIMLFSQHIDLIIQEFIDTTYDVRVIILDGEIIASMKRIVIPGEFRSNASLGAKTEPIKLTELEKRDSIKAAELVEGQLIGVDFLPAKNKEKDQPFILEVNASPGFGAIERTAKGSVTQSILKHYRNRDNWT
jgi:ribosomal protein S6--L-glutamate ligase